ncbi:MAG: histidine--tRNA ligase [Alphaproteobacteria bacterium]|jgi:histidyl-tRNA synthetase|nr:histidine--tRNA ligase [Alphaproteobacteria bacterium]
MSEKKSIYKPRPVSGFPEWLPEVRLVEQQWLDHIRKVFESYGYCSIETPAVEELNVIQAKGGDGGADVDKEVYVIERLHKEDGDKEARLALHFDQTVPLARYVAQHFNELVFPFKRYQMQKVWRGERPQSGRFREFYQCDIDVINPDNLPLHFDAEMPAIIWEILAALPGMENEKIQLCISNRKILIGLCEVLGIQNITETTRIIDKIHKVNDGTAIADMLIEQAGLTSDQANIILNLALIRGSYSKISGLLRDFIARNDVIARSKSDEAIQAFNEGVEELTFVMEQLKHLPKGAVVADLSIVRGLDYYTGTVYETVFVDDPGYGSICSGGRYDDLASNYINKKLPGVGISIGFSRLFARLKEQGKLPVGPVAATDVLVTLIDESERASSAKKAKELRDAGFNVEMYHKANNPKKQFEYAEKKGIPFVFVPKDGAPGVWEVKNMKERKQSSEQDWLKEMEGCCG